MTPDEVMRLGANEALIFTSGRPTIRARKLRYYSEPAFQWAAAIPPPSSDRIEQSEERLEAPSRLPEQDSAALHDNGEDVIGEPQVGAHASAVKPSRAKAASNARQLSFLHAALDHDEQAPAKPERRERLL